MKSVVLVLGDIVKRVVVLLVEVLDSRWPKGNLDQIPRDCSKFCVKVKALGLSDHRSSAPSSRPSKKIAS